MGDPRGFLKVRTRRELAERPVEERIKDWFDVHAETGLKVVSVAPGENGPFTRQPGTERVLPADLVLISVGFLHPDTETILDQLPVELDKRGNIARNDKFATSQDGVFVCGDAGRGQSLVVWAIAEGRSCAVAVDEYLSKEKSELPAPIKASQRPMMLPR